MTADHSDDADVERHKNAISGKHSSYPPLQTCVAAVVSPSLNLPWVSALVRAANGANPIKWAVVSQAVLNTQDESARVIRRGLSSQIIVVTDPMEPVRAVDMGACNLGLPILSLLLDRRHPLGVGARGTLVRSQYGSLLARQVILSSGVGTVAYHVGTSLNSEVDGAPRGISRGASEAVIESALDATKGSLSSATRIASSATTLAATLLDPESRYRSRYDEAFLESASYMRFAAPDGYSSRIALSEVAARRLVLDEGHGEARAIERIRLLARQSLTMAPYAAGMGIDENVNDGFVRHASDDRTLSLQVADVATGWARTLIARSYACLVSEFRLVLYNGRELSREDAQALDKAIAEHRNLHIIALN